jgi:hypothetical protein
VKCIALSKSHADFGTFAFGKFGDPTIQKIAINAVTGRCCRVIKVKFTLPRFLGGRPCALLIFKDRRLGARRVIAEGPRCSCRR